MDSDMFHYYSVRKSWHCEDVQHWEIQTILHGYLSRFSELAGGMVNCGSVLSWMEMDNRGHHLVATDDSGINTPAIAAAHVVKRYTAQAADEISLQVGDMISVIDMPPAEDTIWWRGKRGFEVGFFPCDCVEVIKDKIPSGMTSLFSSTTTASSSSSSSSSAAATTSMSQSVANTSNAAAAASSAASRKPCEDPTTTTTTNDLHHTYHHQHHHHYRPPPPPPPPFDIIGDNRRYNNNNNSNNSSHNSLSDVNRSHHQHHHHRYKSRSGSSDEDDDDSDDSGSLTPSGSLSNIITSSSSSSSSHIPPPRPPPHPFSSNNPSTSTTTPLLSRSAGSNSNSSSSFPSSSSSSLSSSSQPSSMSSSYSASAGISSSAGSGGASNTGVGGLNRMMDVGGRSSGPATLPRCAATFPLPLAPSAYDCSPTMMRKHGKLLSFLRTFFSHRPPRHQLKQSGIVKERVFGCDLGEHLLNSGHDVPLLLKSCTEIIEEYGIVHGIYRLSGITSNIQKLRLAFDEDRVPDLTEECYLQDIHSISSLLKMYFRELPNPLLTYQLYDKFADAVKDEENKLLKIHDVVQQLPPPHYRTTEYLMRHLSRVANFGTETEMHSKNLAIVWAPNLLRSKELEAGGGAAALQGVGIQAVVTECLICYCDIIFSDKMPNYATQELLKGQKKPRPKSLAISTPTRLLSLEEARERAIVGHLAGPRHTKFIDVGGGPKNLPCKYHTVLDVQGYKKKSSSKEKENKPHLGKKSPSLSGRSGGSGSGSGGGSATAAAAAGSGGSGSSGGGGGGGWKSIFSKQRPSSVKKGRKGSGQEATQLHPLQAKALTEEDVHNWKRNLRSAKSAESLFAMSTSATSSSSQRVGGGGAGSNDNDTGEEAMDSSTDGGGGMMTSTDSDRRVVSLTPVLGGRSSGGKGLRSLTHKRSLSSDASAVLHHRFIYDGPKGSRSPVDMDDDDELSPNLKTTTFTRGDSTRRALPRRIPSAPSTPHQDKKLPGAGRDNNKNSGPTSPDEQQTAFEAMELDGEEFSYRKSVTGGDINIDQAIKSRLKQVSDHSMKSMLTDDDLASSACVPLKRCAKTPPKGRKREKQQKPSSSSTATTTFQQQENCNSSSDKPPLVSKANNAVTSSSSSVKDGKISSSSRSVESSPDDPQSRMRHFYSRFHDYAEIVSDEDGAMTTPSSQGTMSLSSSGCNMQDVLDQIDSRLALHAKLFPRLGIGDGSGGGGGGAAGAHHAGSSSSSSSSPYPDRSPVNHPHANNSSSSSNYPNCEEHPYAVIPARQHQQSSHQPRPQSSSSPSSLLPSPSSTSTSFPATASNVLTKETEFSASVSPSSTTTSLQQHPASRETEFPAAGNSSPRENVSQSNNNINNTSTELSSSKAIKSLTSQDLSSYSSSNQLENSSRSSFNPLSHPSFSDNDVSTIIKSKRTGGGGLRNASVSSSASSSSSSSPQKVAAPHQRIQKLQQSGGSSNSSSTTRVTRRRAEFIPSSKAGSADLNNLEDLLDNLETGNNNKSSGGVSSPTMQSSKLRYAGSGGRKKQNHHHHHHHHHSLPHHSQQLPSRSSSLNSSPHHSPHHPHPPPHQQPHHHFYNQRPHPHHQHHPSSHRNQERLIDSSSKPPKSPSLDSSRMASTTRESSQHQQHPTQPQALSFSSTSFPHFADSDPRVIVGTGMCKCLSVPSDIARSLENVLGSQSDILSSVTISELSASMTSFSNGVGEMMNTSSSRNNSTLSSSLCPRRENDPRQRRSSSLDSLNNDNDRLVSRTLREINQQIETAFKQGSGGTAAAKDTSSSTGGELNRHHRHHPHLIQRLVSSDCDLSASSRADQFTNESFSSSSSHRKQHGSTCESCGGVVAVGGSNDGSSSPAATAASPLPLSDQTITPTQFSCSDHNNTPNVFHFEEGVFYEDGTAVESSACCRLKDEEEDDDDDDDDGVEEEEEEDSGEEEDDDTGFVFVPGDSLTKESGMVVDDETNGSSSNARLRQTHRHPNDRLVKEGPAVIKSPKCGRSRGSRGGNGKQRRTVEDGGGQGGNQPVAAVKSPCDLVSFDFLPSREDSDGKRSSSRAAKTTTSSRSTSSEEFDEVASPDEDDDDDDDDDNDNMKGDDIELSQYDNTTSSSMEYFGEERTSFLSSSSSSAVPDEQNIIKKSSSLHREQQQPQGGGGGGGGVVSRDFTLPLNNQSPHHQTGSPLSPPSSSGTSTSSRRRADGLQDRQTAPAPAAAEEGGGVGLGGGRSGIHSPMMLSPQSEHASPVVMRRVHSPRAGMTGSGTSDSGSNVDVSSHRSGGGGSQRQLQQQQQQQHHHLYSNSPSWVDQSSSLSPSTLRSALSPTGGHHHHHQHLRGLDTDKKVTRGQSSTGDLADVNHPSLLQWQQSGLFNNDGNGGDDHEGISSLCAVGLMSQRARLSRESSNSSLPSPDVSFSSGMFPSLPLQQSTLAHQGHAVSQSQSQQQQQPSSSPPLSSSSSSMRSPPPHALPDIVQSASAQNISHDDSVFSSSSLSPPPPPPSQHPHQQPHPHFPTPQTTHTTNVSSSSSSMSSTVNTRDYSRRNMGKDNNNDRGGGSNTRSVSSSVSSGGGSPSTAPLKLALYHPDEFSMDIEASIVNRSPNPSQSSLPNSASLPQVHTSQDTVMERKTRMSKSSTENAISDRQRQAYNSNSRTVSSATTAVDSNSAAAIMKAAKTRNNDNIDPNNGGGDDSNNIIPMEEEILASNFVRGGEGRQPQPVRREKNRRRNRDREDLLLQHQGMGDDRMNRGGTERMKEEKKNKNREEQRRDTREQEAAMEVDNLCNKLVDEMKSPTSSTPPMVFPPLSSSSSLPSASVSSSSSPSSRVTNETELPSLDRVTRDVTRMETEEEEENGGQQSSLSRCESQPRQHQQPPSHHHQQVVMEETQNMLNSNRESSLLLRTVSSPATTMSSSPPPTIPQSRKSSLSKIPRPKTSGGGGDPSPGFQRSYSARLPSPVLANTSSSSSSTNASGRAKSSAGGGGGGGESGSHHHHHHHGGSSSPSPSSSSSSATTRVSRRGSETTTFMSSSSGGNKRLGHARRSSDTKLSDIRGGDSHSPSSSSSSPSSSSRPATSAGRYSSGVRSKTFSHPESSKHSASSPDSNNPRSRIPLSHRIPSPNSTDRLYQQDNNPMKSSLSSQQPQQQQQQQQQTVKKPTSPYPKPRRACSKSGSSCGDHNASENAKSSTTTTTTRNENQSRRNSSGSGKSRDSGMSVAPNSGESSRPTKVVVKDLKTADGGGAKLVIESQPELKKKIQTVHAKKVSQPQRQLAEAPGAEGVGGDDDSYMGEGPAHATAQVSFAVERDGEEKDDDDEKKLQQNDIKIPPPVAKKKFKFNSKSLPRKGKNKVSSSSGEGLMSQDGQPSAAIPLNQHLSDVEKTYPDLVSSRSSLDDSILQLAAERQEILFDDDDDEHSENYGYSTGSLRVKRSQRLQSLVNLFEKGSDSNVSESSGNSPVTRHRTYSASSTTSGQFGDRPSLTTCMEDLMHPSSDYSVDDGIQYGITGGSGSEDKTSCSPPQEKERYPRRRNVSETEDDNQQQQQQRNTCSNQEPAKLRRNKDGRGSSSQSQKLQQPRCQGAADGSNLEVVEDDSEFSNRNASFSSPSSSSLSARSRLSAPPVLPSSSSSQSSPPSSMLNNNSSLSPSSSSSASSSTAVSPGVLLRNPSNSSSSSSSSRPPRYQQSHPQAKPPTPRTRTLSESSAASASSECDSLHIAEGEGGGSNTASPQLVHRPPPPPPSSSSSPPQPQQRVRRSRAHSSSSVETETTTAVTSSSTSSSPPTSPKGKKDKDNKDIERRGSIKELLLMFEKTSSSGSGNGNEQQQQLVDNTSEFLMSSSSSSTSSSSPRVQRMRSVSPPAVQHRETAGGRRRDRVNLMRLSLEIPPSSSDGTVGGHNIHHSLDFTNNKAQALRLGPKPFYPVSSNK